MKNAFNLSIPKPCSEQWQNFRPTSRGGFCDSCSKEVIDFTKLSDEALIAFFKDKPKNACGRFRPDQLKLYHINPGQINPGWQLWKAGLVALAVSAIARPTYSQPKKEVITTEQHSFSYSDQGKLDTLIRVRGYIYSAEDNAPLPGVNVVREGTTESVVTDAEGYFEFPNQLRKGESLLISFIGLKSIQMPITENTDLKIQMENDATQLGGIMVGGVRATNTISFRRWWWKLKSIF